MTARLAGLRPARLRDALRRSVSDGQALGPQVPGALDLGEVGAVLVGPGRLEHRGQILEAGLGEERGDAALAHLALADVRVLVAVGALGHRAVVDVQAAEPVEADLAVEVVDDERECLRLDDVVAAREQVAAVDADADPLAGPSRFDELRELVEVAAERPGACRRCSRTGPGRTRSRRAPRGPGSRSARPPRRAGPACASRRAGRPRRRRSRRRAGAHGSARRATSR